MKRKIANWIVFLTALIIAPALLQAEIKLPSMFGDNMVLQQRTDAAMWGKATARATVKIITSWDKKKYSVKADENGNWKIKLATPSAGGPYDITITDGTTLVLHNVLIGEVWICSGQSNMQMGMRTTYRNQPVAGSNEAIARSTNKNLRLLFVERKANVEPQPDFSGQWKECVPENVAGFSATGYYFGKMLQEVLGVPVGVICAAWGGTKIEPWINEEAVKKTGFLQLPDKTNKEIKEIGKTPTVIFNAMVSPMVGYSIKGVIWYQGESNRNQPKEYATLLPGLIQGWRTIWGIGDFAFHIAQIAPFGYGPDQFNSAFIREVQMKVSDSIPNSGLASSMDLGLKEIDHTPNKEAVGERLAYVALVKNYSLKGIEYSGPVLKEMKIDGSIVNLTFDHATYGLTTFGKDLVNFKIAGEDKRFYPAQAKITKTGISLSSPDVPKPVAVRYAFEDFVVGELYNTEGLPASSFRTDNWDQR